MAHENFFSSKVSTHEQIQGEIHNYCFFFDGRDIVRKEFVSLGQLITSSTRTIGCCNMITRHLTIRFQFENFWRKNAFPYFHILPTAQI